MKIKDILESVDVNDPRRLKKALKSVERQSASMKKDHEDGRKRELAKLKKEYGHLPADEQKAAIHAAIRKGAGYPYFGQSV